MAFTFPTSNATIESFAAALYGYGLGSSTLSSVQSDIISSGLGTGNGLNNTLNNYYSASFGAVPTATVAASIVKNVGLGTDANAIAYVTGQLNAAAPNARGAAVVGILNAFSALTADKTYGAAATAWTNTVSNLVTYAQTTQGDATLDVATKAGAAAVTAAASAGQTFTLTSGVDNFPGTSGNDTFNAVTNGYLSALDTLSGNGGNDTLNIAQITTSFATPTGLNISGINNVVANFAAGGNINTSKAAGFTGVSNLTVSSGSGAFTVLADPTTAVTITNATPGGNASTVDGGSSVSLTLTNTVGADTQTIGGTTPPTGIVTVNDTEATVATNNANKYTAATGAASGTTGATTTVTGGSSVTITKTIGADATSSAYIANSGTTTFYAVKGGAIAVTGTSSTTSVSVTQSAPATAAVYTAASDNTNNQFNGNLGVSDGAVTIKDAAYTIGTSANTISTVTLNGYGGVSTNSSSGSAAATQPVANNIYSNALNTLNLSNGSAGATVGLTNNLSLNYPTTLTLNLGKGTSGIITDNQNHFTTLNVATTDTTATLTGFVDTSLTSVNVSGSGVLTISSPNATNNSTASYVNGSQTGIGLPASVTSLSTTGTGGLKADISGTGITSLVQGNTGTNTIALNSAQSYTGGSGSDIVTITANPLKTIDGKAGTNTLVLNNSASTFTQTGLSNVSNFTTLGAYSGTSGTFNVQSLFGTTNSINKIDVQGLSSTTTSFTGLNAGTALNLYGGTGTTINYATADFNGVNDSVAVTLQGFAITSGGGGTSAKDYTTLSFNDGIGLGIGSVSFNNQATVGGAKSLISNLYDPYLTNLTLSGTGVTNFGTIAAASGTALSSTVLNIVDTDTSSYPSSGTPLTSITTIIGGTLPTISVSGSKAITVSTLFDSASAISISNTNTGTSGVFTVSNIYSGTSGNTAPDISTLRLNGSVAVTVSLASTSTEDHKVLGSTDNANVSFTSPYGTVAGLVTSGATGDTVTLGNGNNTIVTGHAADTITLGTGQNTITAGAGADAVTVGAHSLANTINLAAGTTVTTTVGSEAAYDTGAFGGATGTTQAAPSLNTIDTSSLDVYTGFHAGDKIQLTSSAYTGAAGAAAGLVANGALFTNLTAVSLTDNGVEFIRGTYNASSTSFSGSTTGNDTVMVFDAHPTVGTKDYEAIILVGYVPGSVTGIGGASGLITLA